MKIIDILKNHTKEGHWYDALLWLGWTLVCGLLPLSITLLGLLLFQQNIELSIFTGKGEFALYTASYLGGCFYMVIRDFRSTRFPNQGVLSLIFVLLLVLSVTVYSFISISSLISHDNTIFIKSLLDGEIINNISITILPVAILFSFFIIVTENARQDIDIEEIKSQQLSALGTDFDLLEDEEDDS